MTTDPHRGADSVVSDLVAYLIVSVPDIASLASLADALATLVDEATIRILDLVVLERDDAGAVTAHELDQVGSMAALATTDGEVGGLLSEHDIELASLSIRPGTAGVVLVTEDRWAVPLAAAARQAGGGIVAGERILPSRVAALEERPGPGAAGG
jgi:hypothetical protein